MALFATVLLLTDFRSVGFGADDLRGDDFCGRLDMVLDTGLFLDSANDEFN